MRFHVVLLLLFAGCLLAPSEAAVLMDDVVELGSGRSITRPFETGGAKAVASIEFLAGGLVRSCVFPPDRLQEWERGNMPGSVVWMCRPPVNVSYEDSAEVPAGSYLFGVWCSSNRSSPSHDVACRVAVRATVEPLD